jgi:hypothetical protein
MRIPFLSGRSGRQEGEGDREHRKLLVAEGRVPRPFPGPWTLKALVRGAPDPGPDSVEEVGGEAQPSEEDATSR